MRSFNVISGENALAQQFINLRNDAAGAGNLLVHQQLGAIALPTNPSNTQTLTLTINGTAITITFVTSIGSTAGNVLIGATAAATCANLIALLNQPQTTTATGVALSAANQTLVGYLSWPLAGTTITPCSNNTSLYAPQTAFSASTTATGGSYTAQTMQLYVEAGVVYVSGTRVIFAGASTPTVTAPAANPRIDVLTIDNAGTLAWTTGAENASPTAPTYPANKIALCELYNVVAETNLLDNANQASGQGYISNDVRPFLGERMNWTAFASALIPDGDGTRDLGSASFEWNNGYFKTSVTVAGVSIASARFGGTGADGALTITSGTTTIDVGGAAVFVKNYTSISITGTGALAFTNPHANGTFIILKSQGAITLTSSATPNIDVSSMGAAAGAGHTGTGPYSGANGNNGNSYYIYNTNAGGGGTGSSTGGPGGALPTLTPVGLSNSSIAKYGGNLWLGAGGGAGGQANNSSGTSGGGGIGGGGLLIECGGAWNFTSTIWSKGAAGTNASTHGGGGGGGGGGFVKVLYASLTANSGTITTTGGTGGTNISETGSTGGGGGASALNAGGTGAVGAGSGGTGGNGYSSVEKNVDFS